MTCLQLQLDDIGHARRALEKLSGSKVWEESQAFLQDAEDTQSICRVSLTAGETLLKSTADCFWQRCFVEVFPRGDCGENDRRTRVHPFRGREYSGHLVEMFDKPWFREHKELTASFFKFFVRRDQMNAVGIELKNNKKLHSDAATIHHLHSTDLASLAAKASDSAMLKSILHDDSVIASVRTSLYHVNRIMTKCLGTDSERASLSSKACVFPWPCCSILDFEST